MTCPCCRKEIDHRTSLVSQFPFRCPHCEKRLRIPGAWSWFLLSLICVVLGPALVSMAICLAILLKLGSWGFPFLYAPWLLGKQGIRVSQRAFVQLRAGNQPLEKEVRRNAAPTGARR